MKRGALYGVALVAAADLLLLAGVYYNRSGHPEAAVELTERELPMAGRDSENSGVMLSLRWDTRGSGLRSAAQLAEFGFDPRPNQKAPDPLPRKAFAVLEYEGEAWREWLAAERRGPGPLAVRADAHTRLFAVDVGRDAAALRLAYPDRSRYLVVPCLVDAAIPGGAPRPTENALYIRQLLVTQIHVPGEQWSLFQGLARRPGEESIPRYAVTLRYGRRHEPWVAGARLLEPPPALPDAPR